VTKQPASTTAKGPAWLGNVLSVAAIVVSIIALSQSCSASREANDLSAKNVQIDETQLAAASLPTLQAAYYLADSPSLDLPRDNTFLENFGLSPTLLKSGYWRSLSTSPDGEETRFLFILVSNYGPGTATELSISGSWVPKENVSAPLGIFDLEGPAPLLPPGRFFALLIDVIDSYDPAASLADQTGTHFQSLRVEIEYRGSTGEPHLLEVNAPELSPALMIEPGI